MNWPFVTTLAAFAWVIGLVGAPIWGVMIGHFLGSVIQ